MPKKIEKIEVIQNRSLRILVDGEEHKGRWSVGVDEKDECKLALEEMYPECDPRWPTPGVCVRPLKIGEFSFTLLKSDIPLKDAYPGNAPKTITLVHEDGTETTARVTKVSSGTECEEDVLVTLANGKVAAIDECTLYVLAVVDEVS